MTIAILFWALALSCCGYGALYGGRDGRWIACLYIAALLLTAPAHLLFPSWSRVHWPVFTIDLALLLSLYAVALRTNRYWPLWVAGLHLITMTTHLGAAITPSFAARAYFGMATLWSIPKLLVIVVGVTLDRRAGITDGHHSPSAGR